MLGIKSGGLEVIESVSKNKPNIVKSEIKEVKSVETSKKEPAGFTLKASQPDKKDEEGKQKKKKKSFCSIL
jgi:hypothetical protein